MTSTLAVEDGYTQPVDEPSVADPAHDSRPVEEDLTPEGFDLAAWLAGMRPARRATTIYARPDLLADIDVLAERLQVARAAGDDVEAARLATQVGRLRQEVADSALDVVVQATSEERRAALREQAGIKDSEQVSVDQALALIAAHVVAPEGLDVDALRMIHQASPTQVEKIARAIQVVNQAAPGVPAPFSAESSPSRPRRG